MEKSRYISVVSGANSGLGKSVTYELIRQGKYVAAIGRNTNKLKLLEKEIASPKLKTYVCDIGSYEEVSLAVEEIKSEFSVQYLFNVAGSPGFSHISAIDDNLLEIALSANLKGVVYLSSLLLEEIKQHSSGAILTVLSSTALTGRPDEAAYAASKWGARGFMECLKSECKGSSVKVISAFVGGLKTPFWEKQQFLKPDIDNFMDPDEVAVQLVNMADGIGVNGYMSSVTIEKDLGSH